MSKISKEEDFIHVLDSKEEIKMPAQSLIQDVEKEPTSMNE